MTESDRFFSLLPVVSVVFLVFFEVPLAFNVRSILDDTCYLGWLHRFLLMPENACPHPYHLPGIAVLWIPAGIAGRLSALLTKTDSFHFISMFIGLTSFACWAGSLFLVEKIGLNLVSDKEQRLSPFLVVMFLLSVPVLHYATARSTMAHAGEILLALATVYFASEDKFTLSLVSALWLCATRVNDAPILLVVLGRFLDRHPVRLREMTPPQKRWIAGALVVCGLAAIPVIDLAFIHQYGGPTAMPLLGILKSVSWFEMKRVLWGDYWGLFFTGPFWLLCLGAGVVLLKRLSWMARASLVWMVLLLLVAVGWEGMGNSFGYRYLIGTYAGCLVIWLELLPILGAKARALFKSALVLEALWLTHLTWVYDHFSNYWEIATHWKGMHSVKDLIYPVTRFGLSPLGILAKSLLYPASRTEKFTGPFESHLGRTALWVNAILVIGMLGVAVYSIQRLRGFNKAVGARNRSEATRRSNLHAEG